jgi:hypothetical protein
MKYIEIFYNRQKMHGATNDLSPAQLEVTVSIQLKIWEIERYYIKK